MRLLGVDLGAQRVGIAVSDELGAFAHPLVTLKAGPDLAEQIARVLKEAGAQGIVLGLPLRTGGEKGPEAQRAEAFRGELESLVGVAVWLVDERFTTAEAQKRIQEQGQRGRARKGKGSIDQAAACLILQAFLDKERRHRPPGFGENSP